MSPHNGSLVEERKAELYGILILPTAQGPVTTQGRFIAGDPISFSSPPVSYFEDAHWYDGLASDKAGVSVSHFDAPCLDPCEY